MSETKRELKPGGIAQPGTPKRDPLGSLDALMGMMLGAATAAGAFKEDSAEKVAQERAESSKHYETMTRSFLGATIMELSEVKDENMELRDRLDSTKGRLEYQDEKIKALRAENAKLTEDIADALKTVHELTEKNKTINRSDAKKLLEANNALLIENESLKRSVAAYKGRYPTKRQANRRGGRRK